MTRDPAPPAPLRRAVLAGAALLFLLRLGGVDLWAPDEPRYGQVAEEMRSFQHGPSGLVLLHLNGEVYTQKPPLYFWLAALAGAPSGHVSELAGRLPSALAGIATVALAMSLGARLLGGPTAVLGGALLMTLFEFAHLARRVQLDVLLTLLETCALAAFLRLDRNEGHRGRNLLVLHGALGAAVLTKGPVGFLVPLLVMASTLAFERRLGDLRRAFPLRGLALSVGTGLAWLALAAAAAPAGWLDAAVGTNLFGRFLEGTSHDRPFYYYAIQFPVDFLPWTLLWPVVVWAARRRVFVAGGDPERKRAWRFLLCWVLTSVVFFSLSSGKRGLYLLPTHPAAALLCADALGIWLAGRARLPAALTRTCAGAAGILALAAGVVAFAPLRALEDLVVPLRILFGVAVLAILGAAVLAWRALERRGAAFPARLAVPLAAVFAFELAVFTLLYPALDPSKSPREIARAAAAETGPGEPIGLLSDRAMAGGLVYYSGRRVVELDTPESVRRFFEAGGRAIVVKARKVDRVREVGPVAVRARSRSGSREVVVVTPEAGPGPGSETVSSLPSARSR